MEFPNYYAVLPASVRYDGTLRPNAKLLYAEITALCSAKGYCCAQNEYFAQLYGVSRKTISELVGQLAARRYINVEVLRDEKNQVTGRRIWLPESAGEPDAPIPKNRDTSPEKSGDPIPKNREDLIGRIIQPESVKLNKQKQNRYISHKNRTRMYQKHVIKTQSA